MANTVRMRTKNARDQVAGEPDRHVRIAEVRLLFLEDLPDLLLELERPLVATAERRSNQDRAQLAVLPDVVAVHAGTGLFGFRDLLLELFFDAFGADFRGGVLVFVFVFVLVLCALALVLAFAFVLVFVVEPEVRTGLLADLVVVASQDVVVELLEVLQVGVEVLVLLEELLDVACPVVDPRHVLRPELANARSQAVDELLQRLGTV
jgi:hypothetical protein